MGFWGKAIGAGLGFMLGGPIGAILGGVLGHTYDVESGGSRKYFENKDHSWPELEQEFDRQYLFYVSLASLAAKMAKADGVITSDEIRAFDSFLVNELGLSIEERKQVAAFFNEAKNSSADAVAIARQFRSLIGNQRDVLGIMIQLLFKIALADGKIHSNEEQFIHSVASVFGIAANEFEQIKAMFYQSSDHAYKILGVAKTASNEEVKKTYRKLVQEFHPDKLQAKGVPEDFMKLAHEKMAEINKAYTDIRKERGI
jgi:DnaJ like chaperone protein